MNSQRIERVMVIPLCLVGFGLYALGSAIESAATVSTSFELLGVAVKAFMGFALIVLGGFLFSKRRGSANMQSRSGDS
jgi:hypothetical protein